jgi:hypothetical protein
MNLAQLRSDATLCAEAGVALTVSPHLVLALLNERLFRDEHTQRLHDTAAAGEKGRQGSTPVRV